MRLLTSVREVAERELPFLLKQPVIVEPQVSKNTPKVLYSPTRRVAAAWLINTPKSPTSGAKTDAGLLLRLDPLQMHTGLWECAKGFLAPTVRPEPEMSEGIVARVNQNFLLTPPPGLHLYLLVNWSNISSSSDDSGKFILPDLWFEKSQTREELQNWKEIYRRIPQLHVFGVRHINGTEAELVDTCIPNVFNDGRVCMGGMDRIARGVLPGEVGELGNVIHRAFEASSYNSDLTNVETQKLFHRLYRVDIATGKPRPDESAISELKKLPFDFPGLEDVLKTFYVFKKPEVQE